MNFTALEQTRRSWCDDHPHANAASSVAHDFQTVTLYAMSHLPYKLELQWDLTSGPSWLLPYIRASRELAGHSWERVTLMNTDAGCQGTRVAIRLIKYTKLVCLELMTYGVSSHPPCLWRQGSQLLVFWGLVSDLYLSPRVCDTVSFGDVILISKLRLSECVYMPGHVLP
jgi:hypothetical protein